MEVGAQPDEDGIEDTFELLNEVAEHARGGACFHICTSWCPECCMHVDPSSLQAAE